MLDCWNSTTTKNSPFTYQVQFKIRFVPRVL